MSSYMQDLYRGGRESLMESTVEYLTDLGPVKCTYYNPQMHGYRCRKREQKLWERFVSWKAMTLERT